ncbi:MAG: glycosyltransferase family 2 protein [Candidatus Nanoarchaeia archaeon]|nr:glycosyltransferase family 2 protein [Candidatus Nanoarchaeia archaeon]MDD5741440.1 glycosyltransferase family 2 protein [Candidatus Nanoarchaeia archaeon]
MKKPLVSLILPTYNSSKFIEECLESIKKQTFKDYELIIIDDCSTDNTLEILDRLGYKYRANKENLGYTKNSNKGIKISKGEFICILDHDIVYDKNYLKEIMDLFKSSEKIGMVACKSYYYKEKNKIRVVDLKINLLTSKLKVIGRDEIDIGQFDHLREINATSGGNGIIRKEVFNDIGLFCEDYFIYYVDIDFCLRMKEKGYKIILSKAKSWHKKEEDEKLSKEQFTNLIKDKLIFMRRNSKRYHEFLITFFLFYMPFKIITKPKFFRSFLEVFCNKDP